MATDNALVTIHMVASLDGFIAKKDGDISWLRSTDTYEKGEKLTEEYIQDFINGIDCYVMGSHTYEHAMELGWPYGDKPVFVLTHRDLKRKNENVTFERGDLIDLVINKIKPNFKNIWMVGGAQLTKEFIRLNLANQLVISMMPTILGEGLLFFDYIGQEKKLHLIDVTAYKDGMVEMTYEFVRE